MSEVPLYLQVGLTGAGFRTAGTTDLEKFRTTGVPRIRKRPPPQDHHRALGMVLL